MTEIFNFIKRAPTAYHATAAIKDILRASGYTELSEKDCDAFADGGNHFVVRNGSSIIAFSGKSIGGFMVSATHSDSPAFKLTSLTENLSAYTRLPVERYGGMIHYSWLDRPLSLAGRVTVRTERGIESRLVNIDKDILTIPSVAIHLNRTVNDGYKFNPAVDLIPLAGTKDAAGAILEEIAKLADTSSDNILSHDLFLYNRETPRRLGIKDELVLSPRLDDLACVFAALTAFLDARNSNSVKVLAVFDNEEVGSETKQGANSTFLKDTLKKIAGSEAKYAEMLTDSFMISADNAHARHPNHPELSAPENSPTLGGGVVVKYNAQQRYTTDSVSDAVIKVLAERAGLKLQSYTNRADMPGGSTLGAIADTRVSIPTVDIGIAQLAMHSASETLAARDIEDMQNLLCEFYSSTLEVNGDKIDIIG